MIVVWVWEGGVACVCVLVVVGVLWCGEYGYGAHVIAVVE